MHKRAPAATQQIIQKQKEQPVVKTAPPVQAAAQKIFLKLQKFTRLFTVVGLAAFLGGLIEARCWHLLLAKIMGGLTRMARLPAIVGLAMPTALCSNAAANSILVSSHTEGQIPTSALIAGGMANSYLAYISHSLRVLLPVVAAVGWPGAAYFGMQFTGGFAVLLCVLVWNRCHAPDFEATEVGADNALNSLAPKPWVTALRLAAVRALSLLFRMVCLTVPLILGVEWLLKAGFFDTWEKMLPTSVAAIFPAEMLSLIAAQMGGLVQGAAVAANLRAESQVTNIQILLAMLVGSAVGSPVRTIRRNLPSALAIFSVPVACVIVIGMQLARFCVTLAGIAVVIALMTYTA